MFNQAIEEISDAEFTALSYLFCSIIRRFSLKEAVESKKVQEIYNQISSIENLLARDRTLYMMATEIKNKLICPSCSANFIDLIFECSHTLCGNCFRYYTENINLPQTKQEKALICPYCRRPLKECEYSHIYEEFKEMAKARNKRERMQTIDPVSCMTCKRKLTKNCFGGCCCKCFECQAKQNSLGLCECGNFNFSIYCEACRKKIEPMNEEFYIFCNGHIHCQNCINKSCIKLECQVCTSSLRDIDLEKIYLKAFQTCHTCGSTFNSKYFLSKNCCNYPICAVCQYNQNRTACANCFAPLNPSPQDFLTSQNLIV